MKMRAGFVSNSSSSSFLVNDLGLIHRANQGYDVRYKQLTDSQLAEIEKSHPEVKNMVRPVYLTDYISDGSPGHWQLQDTDRSKCVPYFDGNHGYPYSAEEYDELIEDVWIHKQHNK